MIDAFGLVIGAILRLFRARRTLLLENLALRQQLAALKRRHPRPRLTIFGKVFWVLARSVQSPAGDRQKENFKGSARSDLPDGHREPNLGCAANSWRAEDVRVRCLRKNGFWLDAAGPEKSRTCKAMARVPAESPRSDCRDGFLHCVHRDVQGPLLFFHHQP